MDEVTSICRMERQRWVCKKKSGNRQAQADDDIKECINVKMKVKTGKQGAWSVCVKDLD